MQTFLPTISPCCTALPSLSWNVSQEGYSKTTLWCQDRCWYLRSISKARQEARGLGMPGTMTIPLKRSLSQSPTSRSSTYNTNWSRKSGCSRAWEAAYGLTRKPKNEIRLSTSWSLLTLCWCASKLPATMPTVTGSARMISSACSKGLQY